MMKWIGFIMLLILSILPCHGADETYRSLEYGFSIDYPRELKVIAYDIDWQCPEFAVIS